MPSKVWDEIIHPFPNFKDTTDEVGLCIVMRITSHNNDVTNVCPDSIVCAWQPQAGFPTTSFEIKFVPQT